MGKNLLTEWEKTHILNFMMTDEELISRINVFRDEHKIPPSTFGKMVMNDAKFLDRLLGGGSVTLRTANRVINFIDNYNPS